MSDKGDKKGKKGANHIVRSGSVGKHPVSLVFST